LTTQKDRDRFDDLVVRLRELLEVCRAQSVSVLAPMGQEMVYRYQEDLMIATLANMRRLRARLPPLAEDAPGDASDRLPD
jgi:hypothetical protein